MFCILYQNMINSKITPLLTFLNIFMGMVTLEHAVYTSLWCFVYRMDYQV